MPIRNATGYNQTSAATYKLIESILPLYRTLGLSMATSKQIKLALPERKTGMEMKKPPMAQIRVNDASLRYLFVLKNIKNIIKTT